MGRYNRIDLKHSGHCEEIVLAAAAKPGMRIQLAADGRGTPAGTQGLLGPVRILQEDALQGRTVDDEYAADEIGFVLEPKAGDVNAVLLKAGQSVAVGDLLIVDTDGKYIATTGTPAQTDYEALEGWDDDGTDVLIRVKRIS